MKNMYRFIIGLCFAALSSVLAFGQSGVVEAFAGNGVSGFSGDGGPATLAMLDSPNALAMDKWGNIYVSVRCRIRKITPSGIISTVAGNGTDGYSGDGGPALLAQFTHVSSLAVDTIGNVFFVDQTRRVIRKVATSGIISTIAGTGIGGFSGDGGLATTATMNPVRIAIDGPGNIYVTDNNRVRKISTSGIINTIAGTSAAGFSGDGGPASAAQLHNPEDLKFDSNGNLYIADMANYRIRKIDVSGIITTVAGSGTSGYSGDNGVATSANIIPRTIFVDSGTNIYVCDKSCIRKITATDGIITTVAGNYDAFPSGFGGYAAIAKLYAADFIVDRFGKIYYSNPSTSGDPGCNSVNKIVQTAVVKFFIDRNFNCVIDSGDSPIIMPLTIAIDSNGVTIDTVSATAGFSYNTNAPIGTIYNFRILSLPPGLLFACPTDGNLRDTISSKVKYFSGNMVFNCDATVGFDLFAGVLPLGTGAYHKGGGVYLGNKSCNITYATVSLSFSPKYIFDWAWPPGYSVSGNKITWSSIPMSNAMEVPAGVTFQIKCPASGPLSVGDTVHTSLSIGPVTGDVDTSNNYRAIIDTVHSPFDPNLIEVNPSRCITSGTTLEYTIHFENTGNDTAHNIFVIDSLSDYLDPQSFRLEFASHTMITTRIYSGGHAIMKFDFPNINLLDSSHHGLCDGMFKYTIRTKPLLPPATSIINRAGIYFDVNPVVNTNTVENIIDCPLSVSNGLVLQSVQLYPNPATDELIVKAAGSYSSLTVSNSMGQTVIQQPLQGVQTTVNVKALAPGLYLVMLQGEGGREVVKFVKR